MKVSYQWLKEFVDFDLAPEELADKLTMLGLEVSNITYLGKGLDKILVGQIKLINKHPNADKLTICQVDIAAKVLNIVCGAKNMQAGDKIPVALAGTTLPNGLKIKESQIRGETSEGMLCSEMELGMSDSAEGLMILSPSICTGDTLVRALNLDDVVMELDLTPNRPDCLSILGIAREVAALVGKKLKYPKIELKENGEDINKLTSVTIRDADLCPRYAARVITNVKIKPSPTWMQRKLNSIGLRSINNIVDITNYVLMELGHPLHAFDYNLLAENRIVVQKAKSMERFHTLDEIERVLDSEMLMICDGQQPVAIAGIMGGINSEVKETTTNILLESAYFNPTNIRKTSKNLGLHTEASHRFERSADSEGLITALNRAAQLIAELGEGQIAKGIIDEYPVPIPKVSLSLRTNRTNNILGTALSTKNIKKYLESIELTVKEVKDNMLDIEIPSFRPDLTREIDLIEEVARLYGYNNIAVTMPFGQIESDLRTRPQILENKVKQILISCGFTEVINYSFTKETVFDQLGLDEKDSIRQVIKLSNPLSEEHRIMRTTLVPSLLQNLFSNLNRGITNLKIFELNRIFRPLPSEALPIETTLVAGLISGQQQDILWNIKPKELDFYDIKGTVEIFLRELNLEDKDIDYLSQNNIPFLHPGKSAEVKVKNTSIGFLGEVHPQVLENFDLNTKAFIFQLNFDKIIKLVKTETAFKFLPKYPAVLRDIAIIVSEEVKNKEIIQSIKKLNNPLIEDIKLFDVYQGKPIELTKKSLAYTITYRSSQRTLIDEEVNNIHNQIIKKLSMDVGAKLR